MSPQRLVDPAPVRMSFPAGDGERLTHYLFKYPAKFHPPVVRYLIEKYSKADQTVLDPFCGSGSLLVEAAISGRHGIGTDVDPLAVFVSTVKARRYDLPALKRAAGKVLAHLGKLARTDTAYETLQFKDIAAATAERTIRKESLRVPTHLPNLYHWFRKYVLVDMGRILTYLHRSRLAETHREFFILCFASTIRAASNADPVPVSGVEVTSHMKKKDEEGRIVNPYELFARSVKRSLEDVASYQKKAKDVTLLAKQSDVTELSKNLDQKVDTVITSPPYNIAVDYYRRHLLEMYWLGLTETPDERLAILPKYIGRDKIPYKHPYVAEGKIETPIVTRWEKEIRKVHAGRANSFKHYVVAMRKAFREIARTLKPHGRAVFVVGQSRWNGRTIPTNTLFVELAAPAMELTEHYWYPVLNRYMSYARHNGADIDKEYVLVFKKARAKTGIAKLADVSRLIRKGAAMPGRKAARLK
jgi:tRNA G10  N-methylase Trm11